MTQLINSDLDPILQYFTYAHLPEHLQKISKPFSDMVVWINESIGRCPERTIAFRKLLEAKDATVRAYISDGIKD